MTKQPHLKIFSGIILAAIFLLLPAAPKALAWDQTGHFYIARAAVKDLPKQVPEFFRKGIKQIAHMANQPDVIKTAGLQQIYTTESPNHYLDLERLHGKKLPQTRFEYIKMCHRMHDDAKYIGFLPYAITEWEQRLAVVFAQYRRWPDNKYIQQNALVIAGLLAHYTGDLVQPLHTTVNYDGMVNARGRSPHTGIHQKVDYLPAYMTYNQIFAGKVKPAKSHAKDVFGYVVSELMKSHSKVGLVYSLQSQLPDAEKPSAHLSAAVKKFIQQRLGAGATFTASVMLSAWEQSKNIHLPYWLKSDQYDYHFDPDKLPGQW